MSGLSGKRLRFDETGNVLYLTVVMMLFLVAFSLVLVNVIYVSIMKVKAQNAADHMALSAATLRVRVLNRFADVNAVIETAGLDEGRAHRRPYPSASAAQSAGEVIRTGVRTGTRSVDEFNRSLAGHLRHVAQDNGLLPAETQVRLFPAEFLPWQWRLNREALTFQSGGQVQRVPWDPVTSLTPDPDYLFVQTRVEWNLRERAQGFGYLPVLLPDLVTRSRAEIYRESHLGKSTWRVRLRQPDNRLDQQLKTQTWIQ